MWLVGLLAVAMKGLTRSFASISSSAAALENLINGETALRCVQCRSFLEIKR